MTSDVKLASWMLDEFSLKHCIALPTT